MNTHANSKKYIDTDKSVSDDVPTDGMLNRSSPLIPGDSRHLEKMHSKMADLGQNDWVNLSKYRKKYQQEEQAKQVLSLLEVQKDAPSYGFRINNYRHCLQSATMVMRDGGSEEEIVVTLFHDLGFIVCPENHGEFSASLLANYVSDKHYWMLRHHALFLDYHTQSNPESNINNIEQYRGHPYFEYTAKWVEYYDQTSIQIQYDTAPLDLFKPMVYRIFTRPSKGIRLHLTS